MKKKAHKKARKKSGLTQTTYALSEDLQEIVGAKRMTRPQVVKHLWIYIKKHKCQDAKHRRMINPNKALSAVLGSRPLDMLKIAGHLSKHIKK